MRDDDTQLTLLEDDGISNPGENRPFAEVLGARLSRRKALAGGLAAAATTLFAASGSALADSGRGRGPVRRSRRHRDAPLIDFEPVAVADGSGPVPTVSADYEYEVFIPWGERLDPRRAPAPWDWNRDLFTRENIDLYLTAEEQAERIGIGHDGMWYFPADGRGPDREQWEDRDGDDEDGDDDERRGRRRPWRRLARERGMLCINHEFGTNFHVLGKPLPESLEEVRRSQHAHGVSVVAIRRRRGGRWTTMPSRNARRIHGNTPVAFSGPVAGSELIAASRGDFRGTLNNCANGKTPWGTYLTCEENFNGYFGTEDASWVPSEVQSRYGLSRTGFGFGWHLFDPRFDLADPAHAREENRFGWVVEIDPMDGRRIPVKRTALGRFKHENAEIVVGRGGRVVCYMGDDERFDYIYKFVSDRNWRSMRARGMSPLDHGKLYVAKFHDDGSGEWLELTIDDPRLAARFASQAEVLTYARIAADALGATPMDRPEWITTAPNGEIFCALTNNSRRTVADAANPLAPNPDGHIIRFRDSKQFTGTTFEWDIFLIAEDTHGTEDTFSDPDGLFADPDGRLFIETDGGQKDGLNNQLLVADPETGELRRLLTGVTEDEITGLTVTADRRTLFCNTQHPGDGDPSITSFPAAQGSGAVPRDSTLILTRRDGGIVGS